MKKVCIVTCYKYPDYIRALVLRHALARDPDVELVVIKNKRLGVLRYPEVLLRLVLVRLTKHPDVYILTFRGYELLPFYVLLTLGKKRVYDDLINLIEWVVYEHHKLSAQSLPARVLWVAYRWLLQNCDVVLTDTRAHAIYASKLMGLPEKKFAYVPVGTDESTFVSLKEREAVGDFPVLFCGVMVPLYGLSYVIEAALSLRDRPNINFLIAGGKEQDRLAVERAAQQGARVTYLPWIPFKDLPRTIAKSRLCLAGPFGGTLQARFVTTGKTYQFLAMGVPTVLGETEEKGSFADKQNCLMVPQADAAAIVRAITWAERHPRELRTIGEAGRKTYQKEFSNAVIASKMRAVLDLL